MLAGSHGILNEQERALREISGLPLQPHQKARLEAVQQVRVGLFSDGTGFLQFPGMQQWETMRILFGRAQTPKLKPLCKEVGLELFLERAQECYQHYGKLLGIDDKTGRPVVDLVEDFQQAIKRLIRKTLGVYEDYDTDPEQNEKVESILGPYRKVIEAQRRDHRDAKKNKESKTTPA